MIFNEKHNVTYFDKIVHVVTRDGKKSSKQLKNLSNLRKLKNLKSC